MVNAFTMPKVGGAQLDTTAKDKSHRLTGPFLLWEPALFKSTRRLSTSQFNPKPITAAPSLHVRLLVTVCDISQDYSKDLDRI